MQRQNALKTALLSAEQWVSVILAAIMGTIWMEVYRVFIFKSGRRSGEGDYRSTE
jgi:hypothetical protein